MKEVKRHTIIPTILSVVVLLMSACTNTGVKDYEEIQEYSIKCVEKVLKKLSKNADPGDLVSPQLLLVTGENYDYGASLNLGPDILKKLNGVDYDKIVIATSVDTVMQGSKFCYSLVNVKLPDSTSFQFLVQFDGKGATGTEGKAKVRATRGLVNKTSPTGLVDGVNYQVNYSHISDLRDSYEQCCAYYAIKALKPFINQVNRYRKHALYPSMADFKEYLTTDSLEMPNQVSFSLKSKEDLLAYGNLLVKCGDIVFVYDGEKIIDSYGLFDCLGYSMSLHPNSYGLCSGADGISDRFFGNYSVSDRQILENINRTHSQKCLRYK